MERNTQRPKLRLVFARGTEDFDPRRSSTDRPVSSEMRSKLLMDGCISPLSQSQTVGCDTPSVLANDACDMPLPSRYLRSVSILEPSIGDSYSDAIGQSYSSIGHASNMKKKVETSFWERVCEALEDRGIKKDQQTYVAKLIKIKQPSVFEWTKGAFPSMKNAIDLALGLNVCVEWLLTGQGPKRPGLPSDPYADQLAPLWPDLEDSVKNELIVYAKVKQAIQAPEAENERENTPTRKRGNR